jgi:hypothetical protein
VRSRRSRINNCVLFMILCGKHLAGGAISHAEYLREPGFSGFTVKRGLSR